MFLDSQYWTGARGFLSEHALSGFVEMAFPIPNDPGLEGVVMRVQFVVDDGVGLRLGEVLGFEIGPALP